MKINIEEVENILVEKKIPADQIKDIIKDLEAVVEELKEERGKSTKSKNQLIVIKDGESNWITQVGSDFDLNTFFPSIQQVINDFNETKKGKKNPVNNIADAFEFIPKNKFKEKKIILKTKTPVIVLTNEEN